jgi:prepilin-type N-terminal cleavage/methylation domain-containing protein
MKRPGARDCRGFSLVELLIAVTILGIIVAPLLHTFVTAAGTTARSRRLGDATLASANLAESIEGQSVSALLANPQAVLGADSAEFYDRQESGSYALSSYSPGRDAYHIGLSGLRAGGSEFSAMVTLDAAAGGFQDINSRELAQYSGMDAVFAQSKTPAEDDPDQISLSNFRNYANQIGNAWTGPSDVTRTIELEVTSATADGKQKISATLTFRYTYQFSYESTVIGDDQLPVTKIVTAAWTDTNPPKYLLFPQGYTVVNGVMPSLYLLYYPQYGTDCHDKIIIKNPDNLAFTVFLAKEKDYQAEAEGKLAGYESNYTAAVTVTQTASYPAAATIYSNVRENMTVSGSVNKITGVTYKTIFNGLESQNSTFAGTEGDLVAQRARNRIYQVTVDIYPADGDFTGQPLCTFTAAKLQ